MTWGVRHPYWALSTDMQSKEVNNPRPERFTEPRGMLLSSNCWALGFLVTWSHLQRLALGL